MDERKKSLSRRGFIKTAGAAGLSTALINLNSLSTADVKAAVKTPETVMVPKRPFGKTGVNVSMLSLGGVLKSSDLLIFRQAFKMGVTYWDTADSYGWGKNEKAIGDYFAKFPRDRAEVFLVTKAGTSNPEKLTTKLDQSLDRMNTSYVDMFFLHGVKDVDNELPEEVRIWAEKSKAQGKIRLFGLSTHKNMENVMLAAAKLGWIDGIMMSYNYRLMGTPKMKQAVDACVKAGIGLTAMKTQAAFSANFYASIGSETDEALKMTQNFLKKGYTAEQAKLKVVWENPHIASICSAMPNMTLLQANADAALNDKQLSSADKRRLGTFAHQTEAGYCAGCSHICESEIAENIPICDILRYAMYFNGYGDRETASRLFRALPVDVKINLLKTDFLPAEHACPQKIQIGKIIQAAYAALA